MLATAAQTVFTGLAFAGSGYLFKMIDGDGYSKEAERHNRATEKLAEAKEKFYENEVRQRDKAEKLRREMAEANADMVVTNRALARLATIEYDGREFDRPPVLGDFYKPSQESEEYQLIFIGIMGVGTGYLVWRSGYF